MSRNAALPIAALLMAGTAVPAGAQTITAEEAQANYREMFSIREQSRDCPEGDDDAIVVCGRRPGPDPRLPLAVTPEPGERIGLVPGEMPSATGALTADACIKMCQSKVGIDLIMAKKIVDGIGRLIEGDD